MTPTVSNQPVLFDPVRHRYSANGIRYLSATQIVERFKRPFDVEERSQYMEWRYGRSAQYWKDKWRAENQLSLDRGHKIHDEQERESYRKGFYKLNFTRALTTLPVLKYSTSIPYENLPDGIYPEIMLWRHDDQIAGKSDKVIIYSHPTGPAPKRVGNGLIYDVNRYADVEDYKTNKAIKMHGWQNRDGTTTKMLAPLSHLDDCEFNDYSLQLSIYQYMLEYFGFIPGVRRIIHFPHKIEGFEKPPAPVPYELPYLRDEVLVMLSHLKQQAA